MVPTAHAPGGAAGDGDAPSERETKGERTRRRLLEIAVERFGDRGYRSTSVSEIARAAGLTQAAVYAYFPNKEALFDAAVDADATLVIDEARRLSGDTSARQLVPMLLLWSVPSTGIPCCNGSSAARSPRRSAGSSTSPP